MSKEDDIKDIKNKINKFYQKIKNLYSIKKIILYGSYAKGNATKESDIDIGVVIDMAKNINKIEITTNLFHYASKIDNRFEPICIPLNDYKNHEPASILGEIIKTGIDIIQ